MDDQGYTVEFKILRRTKVKAFDEIQAEIEAFKKLHLRASEVMEVRVQSDDGSCVGDWYLPDREWLGSNAT